MAGLYIHIPFCKSRCIYCAFYSSTHHEWMEEYVDALCREMELRRDFFSHLSPLTSHPSPLHTIYFGGGTPSHLPPSLLCRLFARIRDIYNVADDAEVTVECNPDDITDNFATALATMPVNRVSMGAQSFADDRLRFLHRRHTSQQVVKAVERLRRNGFHNISIDLMFGFPGETLKEWESDIRQAIALDVEHISAYSLMVEEGTPLAKWRKKNNIVEDDDLSRAMYETLIDHLTAARYEHYEISNFARISPHYSKRFEGIEGQELPSKGGFRSRHNSSYWNGTPYIGLGAAAHSYDIRTRSWNVADLRSYIKSLQQGVLPIEDTEVIDDVTRYNDLVTTALRTREGILLKDIDNVRFHDYLMQNAQKGLNRQLLAITDGHLHLTREGLFVSDDVMSDLIYVES